MTHSLWPSEPPLPDAGFIDIHSHLLPGIDDGCRTIEESLECVRRLIAQGFVGTVCTPHYWPEMFPGNRPDEIARRVGQMRDILAREKLDYQLWTGAEVRLADDTVADFECYGVPALGSGRAVLVDYWGFAWTDAADAALDYLLDKGYQPILAHPERMSLEEDDWQVLIESVLARGVWLQSNFNSIAGFEGATATHRLDYLLRENQINAMALDMHRPGSLGTRLDGVGEFRSRFGAERLDTLLVGGPRQALSHGLSGEHHSP